MSAFRFEQDRSSPYEDLWFSNPTFVLNVLNSLGTAT